MFTLWSVFVLALALGNAEASEPLNWVSIEATGSYITGAGGKGCRVIPDSFEIRADGTWYSSSEFNLTGSMDDDCGISITLTIPLDDGPMAITGPEEVEEITTESPAELEAERKRKERLEEIRKSTEEAFVDLDEKLRDLQGKAAAEAEERKRKLEEKMRKKQEENETKKKDGAGSETSGVTQVEEESALQRDSKLLQEEKVKLDEEKAKLEKDVDDLMAMKEKMEKNIGELKSQQEALKESQKEAEMAELNKYLKKFLKGLGRWEIYLEQLRKELNKVRKKQELLDSRLLLFEKWTSLRGKKSALAEEKARLTASVEEFSRRKGAANEQSDAAQKRVAEERLAWERRIQNKRKELKDRRRVQDERRASLTNRRIELKTSSTVRTLQMTTVNTTIRELKTRLEGIKADKVKAAEEAEEESRKTRHMYEKCTLIPMKGSIAITLKSLIADDVQKLWICSIDPEVDSAIALWGE